MSAPSCDAASFALRVMPYASLVEMAISFSASDIICIVSRILAVEEVGTASVEVWTL